MIDFNLQIFRPNSHEKMYRQMSRQISFASNKATKDVSNTDEDDQKKDDRFAQNFMANVKAFFEESKQGTIDFLSDFTVKSAIDGVEQKAHKMILASQSKYFRGLFRIDPTTSTVTLDFETSTIAACLEGIYTGTTPLTFDNVQDIVITADYLGIEDLVKQATTFIIANMDESNCYDVLVFGYDQGNDVMASSAAAYVAGRLYDDPDANNQELYQLPLKIFSKVLESDGLIIKGKKTELIHTGLIRELEILPIIEKYLSINQQTKFEDLLCCCRLDGFDVFGVGKYNLVKKTLQIVLQTSLCRDEKINAVNRASQMSHEMDDIGVIGVMSKDQGAEVVAFCEDMSEEIKNIMIIYSMDTKIDEAKRSLKYRNANRRIPQFTKPYGHAPHQSHERNTLYEYEKQIGTIRKITVHTRLWDDRNCIKGLEIKFMESDTVVKLGLEDGPGRTRQEFELEDGEHIAYVEGRSGWFLDQLTFVTNKNRKLGPVGGDGGDKFSTKEIRGQRNSKDVSWNLGGIQASKVSTQNSDIIAKVRFLMCRIDDSDKSDEYVESMVNNLEFFEDPPYGGNHHDIYDFDSDEDPITTEDETSDSDGEDQNDVAGNDEAIDIDEEANVDMNE